MCMECAFSSYVGGGGQCGASLENPQLVQCESIAQCNKPIKSYLHSIKVYDATLTSESQLLLARAGKFYSLSYMLAFYSGFVTS
jgi:predicted amidophosphoribosyltransferase